MTHIELSVVFWEIAYITAARRIFLWSMRGINRQFFGITADFAELPTADGNYPQVLGNYPGSRGIPLILRYSIRLIFESPTESYQLSTDFG